MVQTFITVSSRNRISGTSTNFRTNIQRQYLGDQRHTIRLITASIPLSFYNINAVNNKLSIDDVMYIITPSKYSALTLAAEIKDIFLLHNPADTSSVLVNLFSGKLNITASHNYTLNVSSSFQTLGLSGEINLFAGVPFYAQNRINLAYIDAMYVRIPGLVQRSYSDFPGQPNDFLACVDITENHLDYAIQKFLPNQSPELDVTQNVISELLIIVSDQENRAIDLNGADTSFTFLIESKDF